MLVVVPSRGRPASLARMLKSFSDTETRCKVLIRIDDDDETMRGVALDLQPNVRVVSGPQVKSVGAMNEAIALYPDEDAYALLGDDCVARTKHWDEILRVAAGDWHIAFPNDLLKGETLAAHPVVGAKFIKAIGFWALPGLIHLYQDKVIDTLGRLYGNLIYRPDVVVEHLHFSVGKSPFDSTYERTFKGVPHAQNDHDAYQAWVTSYVRDEALAAMIGSAPMNIVCVNTGDYLGRGDEYVEKLFDMIERHLPKGNYRYVCLTDKPGNLPNVDYRLVPEGVTGWWAKLYLFKKGLFPDGERCVFFDLDTLVVGQLDDIVAYSGSFATLRDFWRPEGLGPAIILWRAGEHSDIWNDWEAMGRPLEGNGDQTWLETHFLPHNPPDILQNLLPESFVSYKTHCKPNPPKGAKVICFHGLPRPHEVGGWVPGVWKVGGSSIAEVLAVPNTESETVGANIRYACSLDYPWLPVKSAHSGRAVIVAGGPSMKRSLQAIQAHDATVFAVNGVAKVLAGEGIPVRYHVILDARPGNVSFVEGSKALYYLVSSQCDRVIFDALEGRNVMLFHMHTQEAIANIPKTSKVANLIQSGSTVGLATVAIAYDDGFRDLHLYGFDSSFSDDHHAYPQPSNDVDLIVEASAGGRTFKTTPWMVKQAQEFQKLALDLAELGCTIEVHGDGLLPHVARLMAQQMEAA